MDKAEYDMKSYADLRGYNSHHGESKRSKPKLTKHAHHFVKLPSSYHLPIPWQIWRRMPFFWKIILQVAVIVYSCHVFEAMVRLFYLCIIREIFSSATFLSSVLLKKIRSTSLLLFMTYCLLFQAIWIPLTSFVLLSAEKHVRTLAGYEEWIEGFRTIRDWETSNNF